MLELEGYWVFEELYLGEKSIVYRADKSGKSVIIKIIQTEYPTISELGAFRKEYELLESLNHPGIAKVIGTEKYKNSFAIVFEDIKGVSLSKILQSRKPFSFAEILDLALKIANAIDAIHKANIVHRDIKPQNIVFNRFTGELNVIDFGSASLLSRQHSFLPLNVSMEGTLTYISPEQTGRINRTVDYRTDFYSFGVTLYEILVGESPFHFSDPMELVHAHIAKTPISPYIKNNTPSIISEIVMKLLEKNPEDRYQNINGLIHDLQWCRSNLKELLGEERDLASLTFKIGEKDFSRKFQIPEKLYGRTNEISQIMSTFKKVTAGNVELLLISGPSGIGKSILLNELNRPIAEHKGYFLSGKYDQFKRSIPYRAIANAFHGFIQQILSEKEESILRWKEKILSAIHPNAKILIDVIPELESLLGSQESVSVLGIEESQNRFNLVFQKFIEAICAKEHPLAIFLDDLQWADYPSVKLIQNILTDPEINHLLLMLSFRDNENYPNSPLSLMLENIKKIDFTYNEIYLNPISLFDVHSLVAESLSSDKESCRELAEILYSKTSGNPFFVNTLFKNLYDSNLIYFQDEKWNWDILKIQDVEISENVIDLMVQKIKKLPVDFIEILKFSACLGNEFKIDAFVQILDRDFVKLTLELQVISNEGFFIMTENNVRFAHDKIRETIYSMMTEEEKIRSHYKIGKWLLENTPKKLIEENIFNIIGQLNNGKKLIQSLTERLNLVYLNLKAGKKAKVSTAYEGALIFLNEGVSLLPEDKWKNHYSLTLEIFTELVECEYLATHFNVANNLFTYILENARNLRDKIPIYHIQIRQKAAEGSGQEAFLIGFKILEQLGFKMPDISDSIAIKNAFIEQLGEYEQLRGEKPIPDLFYLPEMQDEKAIEAISLITNLGDIAISLFPEMLGLMSVLGVNLSLKYGNNIFSPISYVMWGVVTNLSFLDYKSGYELGQLSIRLNEHKFPSGLIFGKCYSFYGWNIHHWVHHVKQDLDLAKKGFEIAMANSDFLSGSNLISLSFQAALYIGTPLDEVLEYANKAFSFSEKYKQPFLKVLVTANVRLIYSLQGKTINPVSFKNSDFEDEQFLIENEKFGQAIAYFYLRKFQLFYLFGEYEECFKILPKVEEYFPNIPHHIVFAEFHFFNALTLTRKLSEFSNEDNHDYRFKFEESFDFLKSWCKLCEENFLHQFLLVEAEKASIEGRDIDAMQFYEKSIESAKKFEYSNNTALANELAAKYYFSKRLDKVAFLYLQEAYYYYQVWGAKAKIKQIEEKYPNILNLQSSRNVDIGVNSRTKIAATGTTSNVHFLDLNTVIKASQTISSEIQLDKLLQKMIKILQENAGAERSYFILNEKGKWYIKAEGNTKSDFIGLKEEKPLEGNKDLSTGIVNYVVHTKRIVILSDAARKGIFINDEYIKRVFPKSILCYPVMNMGNLLGVVYLENNLSTDTFTAGRVEILNILASQIALSLENSLLYSNLESKVTERTKDLEITLTNLKLTQDELVQSEKMAALGQLVAGVAHEINTPIGAISSSMQSVQRFLEKDFISVIDYFIKAKPEEREFMETVLKKQAESKIFVSSKEKRKIKNNLVELLTKNEIQNSDTIADHLTDIGIYEDIDSYLSIIKVYGVGLLDKVYKLSILTKGLSNIQLATDKTAKIVYALKSYSHKESSQKKTLASVEAGMDTVLILYQNVLNRGIELSKEYDSNLPEILCYPDELNQVWVNLIQNAIHAMDSKGKLTIRIKNDRENILVEILDTGKGIPIDVQSKIFQPFFTTKTTGEGSGLGLGIVEKIIEKHEGNIQFESKPGETKFIITIPIKQ